MDERAYQYKVGVMVLATFIFAAILALLFGELPAVMHGSYTIHVMFDQAPKVTTNTPVRTSGVLIGRVEDVTLTDDDRVKVTVSIDAKRKLRSNQVCRVRTELMGDVMLEFVKSEKAGKPDEFIQPGVTLEGVVAVDPVDVIRDLQGSLSGVISSMSVAIDSVAKTSDDLGGVVLQVADLLKKNEGRINSVLAQADETLEIVREAVVNVSELTGDPEVRKDLKETVSQLPDMLRETRETVGRMNETITLVDQNLRNIEDFTKPLGENGGALVGRIDHGVRKLDLLMAEMLKFSRSLNNQEGTLGQLANNPELYNRLNRAAMNIDELTRQLRPIIDDARIFSDKIARHPELLGVRGAIQRNSGLK